MFEIGQAVVVRIPASNTVVRPDCIGFATQLKDKVVVGVIQKLYDNPEYVDQAEGPACALVREIIDEDDNFFDHEVSPLWCKPYTPNKGEMNGKAS